MKIPKITKPRFLKYNLPESEEFESSYCQNADCPNNNKIKKGKAVQEAGMIFCSKNCLTETRLKIFSM